MDGRRTRPLALTALARRPPRVATWGDAALDPVGVEHEVVTYPGAPHSFFDRKQEEFARESGDAWERALAFLERYG